MMREYERIRAAIIRGGTSKGVFILQNELPEDPKVRDQVILSIYGQDARQIDGLGGADALTSKFAMVRPSPLSAADIEYTFGQVGIGTGHIDYNTNCGNILSGVGPFAVDEGLVCVTEPYTKVRIHNTNTDRIIIAHVPVENGRAKQVGNFHIDGVPGGGAKIMLDFQNAAGAKTGALFPTGARKDWLDCSYGKIATSIVDVTTPVAFINASDVGMTGVELPEQLTQEQLFLLEEIRGAAATKLGFVAQPSDAARLTPASPKLIIVSEAEEYETAARQTVHKANIDFVGRAMSMQQMHKTFPVTGGLCTAVASKLQGTVVHECCSDHAQNEETVRVGHPSGTMEFHVSVKEAKDIEPTIEKAAVARTARRIMEGFAYAPAALFWGH
ncbi:2-methylaconitate cis-trans isomerase PrpF family protein [Shouchella clausii]|uniref:2-methylaconitate cis-trans isomerase PrpF family protein n=2 Tax=Shouchella clausii TaxID=79880 RepID=UPI0021CCA7C9|nr:PrpF domain-containing protein [Shouchella clausii]